MNNIKLSRYDIRFILDILLTKYANYKYNQTARAYYPQHSSHIIRIITILFLDSCSQIKRIKCKIYYSSATITDICILEFNDIYKLAEILNIKITDEMITQALLEVL